MSTETTLAHDGALTQLPVPDGCISSDPTLADDCTEGTALDQVADLTTSPDGRHVYVVARTSAAVAAFERDLLTGALTQLPGTDGCISETGTEGACAIGKALLGAFGVTVSPDGRHVYVAAFDSGAVAVFERNRSTGALTQLPGTDGCVSETGTDGACAIGRALFGAFDVAVSPDGRHVYLAAQQSSALAIFERNLRTGALTQLAGTDGCIASDSTPIAGCALGRALAGAQGVAPSRDGRHVYVVSVGADAVAVFARDRRTGALTQLQDTDGCITDEPIPGCAVGKALGMAQAVVVSRDGRNVYVTAFFNSAVAAFERDRKTGALTQLPGTDGCVSSNPDLGEECVEGIALDGAARLAVSRDGRNLYVASASSNAVAALARDRQTGALAQLAGTDGCVSSDPALAGACAEGVALFEPTGVLVSRDGRHVYVAALGSAAVDAFARARR